MLTKKDILEAHFNYKTKRDEKMGVDDLFKIVVIACLVTIAATTIFVIVNTSEGHERAQPICEELAPGWATYVFGSDVIGDYPKCAYSNKLNARDNNYLRKEYYLIDNNHLGKEVD